MKPNFRIFEVGPRDGLQNEPALVSLKTKMGFIQGLAAAGIRDQEVGAFVRSDRVPQMADTEKVFKQLKRNSRARYWALIPNRKGLERALESDATHLAIFTAATDSFARENIGMSIRDSLREFAAIFKDVKATGRKDIEIRGYISTAFGCPFEGKVAAAKSLRVIEKLGELGVCQVSVGDTIGVATPRGVDEVMRPALKLLGAERTAGHFHDTRGTALANALRAIELGVTTLDSSAGGLGGCPFAPGATGNLATEDLVYMLDGMGIQTGIDLKALCKVSLNLARLMRRPLGSRYLQAYRAQIG
jgi:hydroxymethylglutaryl-CoA lyase